MQSSVYRLGPLPEKATATLILVHGRGASAESILSLYPELAEPTLAALAPQAPGFTWYPNSFLAPLGSNQPHLDLALARLEGLVTDLAARGVTSEQVILLGFSQGACLVSEYAARHPRRYGAVVGLIGGLIGPPGTPRDYPGSLAGTPVFLGCSDPDPHVPFARVLETEQVLTRMGGIVEVRRYPGVGHTVVPDQLEVVRSLVTRVAGGCALNGILSERNELHGMTDQELALARRFREKLVDGLGPRFLRLRAFGSRARGVARADSDLDLFVLVDRADRETRRQVAHWASDVMMETDECICVNPLVMDPERLARLTMRERRLPRDIENDGVEL